MIEYKTRKKLLFYVLKSLSYVTLYARQYIYEDLYEKSYIINVQARLKLDNNIFGMDKKRLINDR